MRRSSEYRAFLVPPPSSLIPRKSETWGAFPCRISGISYDALAIDPPSVVAGTRQPHLPGVEMNIFVGNLGPDVTETEIEALFKPFGQVKSVQLVRELFTGKGKGFGFVEMPGRAHSLAAIAGLNGKEVAGRPMKVNEARPRPERGRRYQGADGGNPRDPSPAVPG